MSDVFEQPIDEFSRYRIGITTYNFDPAREKFKHMLYLVAYDIRDPKRLRLVAKTCKDYGLRVEYSVFECDLAEEIFCRMWDELLSVMDAEEDAILAYRICGACVTKIESAGAVIRPGKVLLYMI